MTGPGREFGLPQARSPHELLREHGRRHLREAEALIGKSPVRAQVHATLALYYQREGRRDS